MEKKRYIIFGICFFILAVILVRFYEPQPSLNSITQTSGGRTPYLYEGIVKGLMAVQEVTLKKDYLDGVAIRFATKGRENTSLNALIVFDSNFAEVYHEKFSSVGIEDAKYKDFRFNESKKVGRGMKVYVCLISKDGDSVNSIHGLFNSKSKLGPLYATLMVNEDLILSVRNKVRLYPGALMMRTYESDHPAGAGMKKVLYFAVFLLSVVICLFPRFRDLLARATIRPEYVYLPLALVAGILFLFITPPGQVPDENSHMARTAELSELQLTKFGRKIPAAYGIFDSTFQRMHFSPDERTSKEEILSTARIKIDPQARRVSDGPNYIVPYLPQLLGLEIGRIFTNRILYLFYFARLINLLAGLVIIFFAIRITPVGKWLLLMLALMPKTMFLMGSLSYDVFVISGSFLLIALYLRYALKHDKPLGWKDLGLLFLVSLAVAFCKPPYFLLGFLFLIIPVKKIGSVLKYAAVFAVFVVSMLMAQGMGSLVTGLVKPAEKVKTEKVATTGPAEPAKNGSISPKTGTAQGQPPKPEINPSKQLNYVRNHIPGFVKMLLVTNFRQMRKDILNNFVGTMGWLDTFLPNGLVNFYLVMLLVIALCMAEENLSVGWKSKTFFLFLFVFALVAIESSMYLYSTVVGNTRLFGIQGRYFIPLAPMFLLVFYNYAINEKMNYLLSAKRGTYLKAKQAIKPKILQEIRHEQIFSKYLQVFIILLTVLMLARGIAAVLMRYYVW